jgi:hypothetical protein
MKLCLVMPPPFKTSVTGVFHGAVDIAGKVPVVVDSLDSGDHVFVPVVGVQVACGYPSVARCWTWAVVADQVWWA